MYYITVKQSPVYHQMTLDELLFSSDPVPFLLNTNSSNTKTYEVQNITDKFRKAVDVPGLIQKLIQFNDYAEPIRNVPRHSLYREFLIPKRNGGKRRIDAPDGELKAALYMLKSFIENDCGVLYHTSAFAYVKHRCAVDAVKRHQTNNSKWFAKFDFSNFFGSTTLDFVMDMFSKIFPLCCIIDNPVGKTQLRKALELAFLDGVLPQGTPISPLITNVMMIPIDFELTRGLRNFENQKYIYTRYADDLLISSRYTFDFHKIEDYIMTVLNQFGSPHKLKHEKTRYGSSSGRNWNLGVMLNADNEITIGHKKKKQFQAMVTSYLKDRQNGKPWEKNDIQVLQGQYAYYKSVEGDTIDRILTFIGDKFSIDIIAAWKADLSVT